MCSRTVVMVLGDTAAEVFLYLSNAFIHLCTNRSTCTLCLVVWVAGCLTPCSCCSAPACSSDVYWLFVSLHIEGMRDTHVGTARPRRARMWCRTRHTLSDMTGMFRHVCLRRYWTVPYVL